MLGGPGQPGLYLLAAHDVFDAVDNDNLFEGDVRCSLPAHPVK